MHTCPCAIDLMLHAATGEGRGRPHIDNPQGLCLASNVATERTIRVGDGQSIHRIIICLASYAVTEQTTRVSDGQGVQRMIVLDLFLYASMIDLKLECY